MRRKRTYVFWACFFKRELYVTVYYFLLSIARIRAQKLGKKYIYVLLGLTHRLQVCEKYRSLSGPLFPFPHCELLKNEFIFEWELTEGKIYVKFVWKVYKFRTFLLLYVFNIGSTPIKNPLLNSSFDFLSQNRPLIENNRIHQKCLLKARPNVSRINF